MGSGDQYWEVLVLYLKRPSRAPRSTTCREAGASDTALRLLGTDPSPSRAKDWPKEGMYFSLSSAIPGPSAWSVGLHLGLLRWAKITDGSAAKALLTPHRVPHYRQEPGAWNCRYAPAWRCEQVRRQNRGSHQRSCDAPPEPPTAVFGCA